MVTTDRPKKKSNFDNLLFLSENKLSVCSSICLPICLFHSSNSHKYIRIAKNGYTYLDLPWHVRYWKLSMLHRNFIYWSIQKYFITLRFMGVGKSHLNCISIVYFNSNFKHNRIYTHYCGVQEKKERKKGLL